MREKHQHFVISQRETTFFIGPVKSSTVARWIKSCLQKAGIDTSKFQAHSVRAAATSKADCWRHSTGSGLVQWKCLSEVLLSTIILRRVWNISADGWVFKATRLSPPKYNCRMAQVMQWPPAIRNYMRSWNINMSHPPLTFICCSCMFFSPCGYEKAEVCSYWLYL